jgi:ribosomal-protein-alanine N-acetyltransferase
MSSADIQRVVEIAAGLASAPQWPASVYFAALEPEHFPRRIALVASDPGRDLVLGFAIASVVQPEAQLESIAVAANAQRRGLGATLLQTLILELRKNQVTDLILEVRASNAGAVGFYRAHGFGEDGRRTRYYADPVEDAILMRLRLG